MANIGTGITSFLGGLYSGAQSIATSLTGALGGLTPLISSGLNFGSQLLASQQVSKLQRQGYSGYTAYPGGAPMAYPFPASGLLGLVPGASGSPAQQAGFFGLGSGQPQLGPGGTFFGLTAPDSGTYGPPMPRMARQMQVTDARGRIRTYVLAPMVRYRVSIARAGARRRCGHRGGR
jgi:hypothetical protein